MNEACSVNLECDPGLRCAEGICSLLLPMGTLGCNTDFDCVSNCGCIPDDAGSAAKKCVAYFTQKDGMEVDDCRNNDGVSLMCQSGFCTESEIDAPRGTCGPPPANINHPGLSCTEDSFCDATDGTTRYNGTCSCGYNRAGLAYCEQFLGSPTGQQYFGDVLSLVHSGSLNACNTERRFQFNCTLGAQGNETVPYHKFVHSQKYFHGFPKLYDND